MLCVNQLFLKFKKKVVFNNISFEIPSTGITIINGDSGAGKTSFFKCVTNENKFKGDILIDNTKYLSNDAISNQKITMSFTENMLDESQLVIDFMRTTLNDEEFNQSLDYLKRYRMNTFRYQKIKDLSKGQQARISIILSLSKKCDYYFFDEPSAALDDECIQLLIEDFKKLSKDKSVIVSTHDITIKKIGDVVIDFNNKEQYQNKPSISEPLELCKFNQSNRFIEHTKLAKSKKYLFLLLPLTLFIILFYTSLYFNFPDGRYTNDISRNEIMLSHDDFDSRNLMNIISNNDDILYVKHADYDKISSITVHGLNTKIPSPLLKKYQQSKIIENWVPRNDLNMENGCSISNGFYSVIKEFYFKLGLKEFTYSDIKINDYKVLAVYDEEKIECTFPSFASLDSSYDYCPKSISIVEGEYPKYNSYLAPYSLKDKIESNPQMSISGYYDDTNVENKIYFQACNIDILSRDVIMGCKDIDSVLNVLKSHNIKAITSEQYRNDYYFGLDTTYLIIGIVLHYVSLFAFCLDGYVSTMKKARVYYNNGYSITNINISALRPSKEIIKTFSIGLIPCFVNLIFILATLQSIFSVTINYLLMLLITSILLLISGCIAKHKKL